MYDQHDQTIAMLNEDHPRSRPPPKTAFEKVLRFLRKNLLLTLTIAGVILGLLIGFTTRLAKPSPESIMILSFPGDILMRMLKMLILPLITSSLITGLAVLDPKSSGKMGLYALTYYFCTTVLAAILGIVLVSTIKPGERSNAAQVRSQIVDEDPKADQVNTLDAIFDLLRNMFAENIIQAGLEQVKTTREYEFFNDSGINRTKVKFHTRYIAGANFLGLITFCCAFGIVIGTLGRRGELMLHFFIILNEIVMKLIKLVMWYSPIGIMFLVAGKILEIEDLAKLAKSLGMYAVTVLVGLAIHALITLPLIFFVVTRKNPFLFYRGVLQAWLTGIGTASSAATLPVTFRCLEENLKLDRRVTRFVLPIGATVNMDGTALYEAVAPVFLAQLMGRHLGIGQLIVVSLTATVASIGAASIPSAGLVTMLLVMSAVNIPAKEITIILAIDWALDRVRTSVNILGDAIGAGIVDHLCKGDLGHDIEEGGHHDGEQLNDTIRIKSAQEINETSKL
ncbi:unnamed protein product [Didymodactylos carnosus]|uniref:Amino acid transporter n=1 Tax=Didymodactylos carnosus TaxID=1234261 RepID=A0A814UG52_9BILA|nr:unnamed protein product [Didymodactylos carnosus]CAF1174237.1 unnamed protein product [Didymodactylos carnosus]CAF3687934.1 unnamed protein product [Didymodactylos carnosus]CAF3938115.1 unnamed protein product [Didymodactylos carnosus]